MTEYEHVQMDVGHGMVMVAKYKDKKTGNIINYRLLSERLIDEPLVEIIEEFNIPVIRIPGKNYKIRYVALVAIRKALKINDKRIFSYPQKIISWIHPRETISKREYNTQVQGETQFTLAPRGSKPILVSLADAIQILTILQKDEERSKLIKKLIIKIEELQEQLIKKDREEIKFLRHQLEQLDDICYKYIKEHGKDKYAGYKMLWEEIEWQMVIDIIKRIREILGLPVPPRNHAGLHHPKNLGPYRNIYPHVATYGKLIDKRYGDHEDPRNKKYWI